MLTERFDNAFATPTGCIAGRHARAQPLLTSRT
jgi:hypothetical protein